MTGAAMWSYHSVAALSGNSSSSSDSNSSRTQSTETSTSSSKSTKDSESKQTECNEEEPEPNPNCEPPEPVFQPIVVVMSKYNSAKSWATLVCSAQKKSPRIMALSQYGHYMIYVHEDKYYIKNVIISIYEHYTTEDIAQAVPYMMRMDNITNLSKFLVFLCKVRKNMELQCSKTTTLEQSIDDKISSVHTLFMGDQDAMGG